MTGPQAESIAALVGELAVELRARGQRITTAESCTGGLIAAACTDLAGSSDWFERGFVTYSDQAKAELLGVDPTAIQSHGAVSEVVARAMAAGALAHSAADFSLAVTGIAGPSGGSAQKPVGTVWLAWARRAAGGAAPLVDAALHRLAGDRADVRQASVRIALAGLLALVKTA
jgi:nicotinamide-nucleotide amidase